MQLAVGARAFSAEKTVEIVQKEEHKIQDHGEIARVLQGSQAL